MQLYVVIVEDRHEDVQCEVFDTAAVAIAYAKHAAAEIAHGSVEEEQIEGWLYAARCSSEDDYVHVVEKTLNQP